MTINDFKNLDEMPWGKHRLMGDFSLRQNEQKRNDSYWNIYVFFRDKIYSEDKELGDLNIESNRKREINYLLSYEKREIYNILLREHFIPYFIGYSGIVKGVVGDAFVMDVLKLENVPGRYEFETDIELHTDIFASYEERKEQSQKYIDFELSNFETYICENGLNDGSIQVILDVIREVVKCIDELGN